MRIPDVLKFTTRGIFITATALVLGTLGGCYVVPLTAPPTGVPATQGANYSSPTTMAVRLYPANEVAHTYGMVSAVVTNDMHGRGTFSTNIQGESFSGEATRVSHSTRDGIANGAGNRGGFISCTYKMSSTTLGTGTCTLSNGAIFNMHVGG